MSNILNKIKNTLKKGEKCDHDDFWTLYKIINFHRKSMTGTCGKCGEIIQLEYLGHEIAKKDFFVRSFSWVLWASLPCVVIVIASILAQKYGPWMYIFAIIDVVILHFWAMYYIIRGGLIKVTVK